jgi:hypothetical protein
MTTDPFQGDRNPMTEMSKVEMTKALEYWDDQIDLVVSILA